MDGWTGGWMADKIERNFLHSKVITYNLHADRPSSSSLDGVLSLSWKLDVLEFPMEMHGKRGKERWGGKAMATATFQAKSPSSKGKECL